MSAGVRLPANQLAGVSPPPATSQLSRLRVLSVGETFLPCCRQVAAGDQVAAVHRARQRHVDEAQRLGATPRA